METNKKNVGDIVFLKKNKINFGNLKISYIFVSNLKYKRNGK